MYRATALFFSFALLITGTVYGQSTEYVFNPERTGALTDAFPVGAHNGARGLSGPWDLDRDGRIEVLVAQHDAAGGTIHVIENTGPGTWELVYSTALIDSSSSSSNARYATAGDLDGDGNWEIIFVAGTGYSDADPALVNGVQVWEHDGIVGSDNYGTRPATIGNFFELDGIDDGFVRSQNLEATDIDGDGVMELLVPADGNNAHDIMYILSVSGTFEPNGVGTGFEAWTIERRVGQREDGNAFGGGSSYDIIAADMNGDGNMDLSFHAWNNFNFFNGTTDSTDNSIILPEITAPNRFFKASPSDHVALFGGIAYDMDGDGNDEVFYPNWQTKSITVIDYDDGADVLQITAANVAYDVIPIGGAGGIAVGDIDGDGNMELITGGSGYSAGNFNNGQGTSFITIAEFNGGDPSDGANYAIETIDTSSPLDTTGFNVVYRDSLGTITKFYETAFSKQGVTRDFPSSNGDPVFPSGIAYLGDVDGNGSVKIAISFQGIDDSLRVYDEFWNPDSVTAVFNTPVGAASPAPIFPGEAYEFEIDAAPGSALSFATMFIPSNDLFYAPADSGIALWNADGTQRNGDVTAEVYLWDAGTELNEEPYVGPNQAPNQAGPNTGAADTTTTVRMVNDGFAYPATPDVILVTLTPTSATKFTVRIENVSGTAAPATPLAPGVWFVHTGNSPLFTEGQDEPGDGLEGLAEDGTPGGLNASLAAEFGFHRSIREQFETPVRPFLRIISIDGLAVSVEDDDIVVPSDYVLSPNYPNPFNPSTSFTFTLPLDKRISIKIYNVMGRLVATLVDDELYVRGTHQATWDGTSMAGIQVASGTYLYTLEHGNFRKTRTMILIK